MRTKEIKRLKNILKYREENLEELKKEIEEIKEMIEILQEGSDNSTRDITKAIAIKLVNENTNLNIRSKDVIFSNKNKTTREWWFEPSLEKFKTTFYIILNDEDKNRLYIFKIPKNTYPNPLEKFYYRKEKGSCSIRIDGIDTLDFRDKLGSNVRFEKFRIETLEY